MADSEPPKKKIKESVNNANTSPRIEFNPTRLKQIYGEKSEFPESCTGVGYYMHRDQRVQDNWSMIYAQQLAIEHSVPLHVVCLITSVHPDDAGATFRHLKFCFEGLKEVAEELVELNIAFHLLIDQGAVKGGEAIVEWMKCCDVNCLVTDFSPLRTHRKLVQQITASKSLPVSNIYQVDAHNIVPVEIASSKQEYSARTIRSKITSKLSTYLTEFPPVTKHTFGDADSAIRYFAGERGSRKDLKEDWDAVLKSMKLDEAVKPCELYHGGSKSGLKCLQEFVGQRIKKYSDKRNDPTENALSNLSPWFHMGNLSVQRAVLYVKEHASSVSSTFIEEAVVRRELADNFCYYNDNYDNIKGASDWALKTLNDHRSDKREYVYSRSEFDEAKTHDELWNAAQRQLTTEGKMHGFMRMYWAKKILEWTKSPDIAVEEALYFNDHYSLDGSDANGFVGVMWSICGIHDQGWAERPVFGKIRYMNYNGCKRKFDVELFIRKYKSIKK